MPILKMTCPSKICTKCNIEKPLTEFYERKDSATEFRSNCKICMRSAGKNWRKYHKKEIKAHRITTEKERKTYYYANRKKILSQIKARSEEINANKRQRRKTDLKFKLNNNISGAIHKSLKGNKGHQKWQDLVGYTTNQLIKRLKSTLPDGYVWDDYIKTTQLHIDHIIPISVFNFTKPEHEDFKKCWALKNLQLLPAKDNWSKHAKITKHFQPSLLI